MLCEKCKKQFVGDTPLCPACQQELALQEAKNTISHAVKNLIAYVKIAFVIEICIILIAFLLLFLFPLIWFIFAALILVATIHIPYIYREMKIWFSYQNILKSGNIDDLITDVMKRPKGVYQIYLAGNCGPKNIMQHFGLVGMRIIDSYCEMEFATRLIERIYHS